MSGIFGQAPQPAVPQVAVAPAMPNPTSPNVIEAQNVAAIQATKRAGRQSTILGQQGGGTVADTYSGSKLGSS